MNVYQYLTEMRAAGYCFHVIDDRPRPGILILNPVNGESAEQLNRTLALETWRRDHCTKDELRKAILNTPPDPGQPNNLAGRNNAA